MRAVERACSEETARVWRSRNIEKNERCVIYWREPDSCLMMTCGANPAGQAFEKESRLRSSLTKGAMHEARREFEPCLYQHSLHLRHLAGISTHRAFKHIPHHPRRKKADWNLACLEHTLRASPEFDLPWLHALVHEPCILKSTSAHVSIWKPPVGHKPPTRVSKSLRLNFLLMLYLDVRESNLRRQALSVAAGPWMWSIVKP